MTAHALCEYVDWVHCLHNFVKAAQWFVLLSLHCAKDSVTLDTIFFHVPMQEIGNE